jgi:hypothetical protein
MYRVEFRQLGEGLWSRAALPMTQQGADHLAASLQTLGFADETRVVPAGQRAEKDEGLALDIRV